MSQGDVALLVSLTREDALWQVAGSTIVFYDHLTTLDQEIELIWLREWSFTSFLFFLTRYVGGACFVHTWATTWASGSLLDKVSASMLEVQAWLSQVAILAMNTIIVKRVVCMYNGDRRVLSVLAIAVFITAAYSLILTILAPNFKGVVVRIQLTRVFETCQPVMEHGLRAIPTHYLVLLAIIFMFEAILFLLSLAQGIRFVREKQRESQPRASTRVSIGSGCIMQWQIIWKTRRDLASVLLRDSILFPFINLMLATLNIMAGRGHLSPKSIQGIRMLSAVSIPTIGCRLILNLREAYYKPFRDEYNQSRYSPDDSLVIPGLELELDELGSSASVDLAAVVSVRDL
ncbi:hypothetical protein BKA70DRAFT_1153467, partial [Coprinopsis sp. MPI-PUGE-AT-0042]